MNLGQLLEQRAERGTPIGSTVLMARVEAELAPRRFSFTQPGLGFVGAAVVTLVVVGGVLLALRPDSEPLPPADTSTTTTTVADTTTTEVTVTTGVDDEASANRQFVLDFQPGADDPNELRTALESYDGSSYDLIRLIDEGDLATRDVVFEYLIQPSASNVQTLVLMQRYGRPGGTGGNPEPWPSDVRWEIFSALREATRATFGEGIEAELAVDLQLVVTEQELEECEGQSGTCSNNPAAWYAMPQVVGSVDVQTIGPLVQGTMAVTSDTGAGDEYQFVAIQTDSGWRLLDGYRTNKPFVSISGPAEIVANGDFELYGYADPDAELTIGSLTIPVDPETGSWETTIGVTTTRPGWNEIVVAATIDGATNTDTVLVRYESGAFGQFAFIKGIDTSGPSPALVVDYAEFLSGDEAVQAAIEDGQMSADEAGEGLPNDFYIRNNNPLLRTLPFDDEALIYLFDYAITEEFDYDPVGINELVRAAENADEAEAYGSAYYFPLTDYPVWLMVEDETILQVTPQYLP